MNFWYALIIGLIIGWLLELLIDFFYWRKRRICPDDGSISLRADLDNARSAQSKLDLSLKESQNRIAALEADLNGRNARIGELESELADIHGELKLLDGESDGWGLGSIFADGKLKLGNLVDGLKARFNEFRADLDAKDVELDGLRADLNSRDVTIGNLNADLHNKNLELGGMRAEISAMDDEVKGLGLGSMLAGGGLAISGFLDSLRHRFNEFRADLDAKNVELNSLRDDVDSKDIKIGELSTDLHNKNLELGEMRTEINTLDDEVQGFGLGSLLSGGGLAISGFLASLRDRFDGDDEPEAKTIVLDADVDTSAQDAEIAQLNGRIADLESRLSLSNRTIAEYQARDDRHEPRGLSMIWGLNTQANNVLERQGIDTYTALAQTSVDDISDALVYSERYYPNYDYNGIHGSWVEQSRIAAGGDWDGLYVFQRNNFNLVGLRDDLKKIWGIGPKIEQVLNNHGIYLFSQVASVPAERITEILRNAGDRFNISSEKLHETWPKQARIADLGEWEVLKEFQDGLSWSNVQ